MSVISNSAKVNTLEAAGATRLKNTLTVDGASEFKDVATFLQNVTFNSDANFNGSANFAGGITTPKIVSKEGEFETVNVSNSLNTKDLSVKGKSILEQVEAKSFDSDSVTTRALNVDGGAEVGSLEVTGHTQLNTLSVSGLTTIDGSAVFNGTVLTTLGIQVGDANTGIMKSVNDDRVRINNRAGYLDIGTTEEGIVEFSTDAAGYEFDKQVTASNLFKVEGSDSEIRLEASGQIPSFVLSGKNGIANIALSAPDKLVISQASLELKENLVSRGTIEADGKIYADAGLHVRGDWVRVDGNSGLYFQSHGGGWHMTDSTWLRAYNSKSIFTGGIVRGDGGIQVDGKWIASSDGKTLYENNVALSNKYLGINSKAKDADKLDGIDSNSFARRDANNNFSGFQTFSNYINANGGLKVDGKWIASSNGVTLYENGVALSSKYLAKTATAANANKLGNIVASKFARTDIDEIFDKNVTASDFKLKSSIGGKRSLKDALQWIDRCEDELIDVCIKAKSGGDNYTALYVNKNGLAGGDIRLNQSYRNFEQIVVIGGSKSKAKVVTRFSPAEYDLIKATTGSNQIQLVHQDGDFWRGEFTSNTYFDTKHENTTIFGIYGLN